VRTGRLIILDRARLLDVRLIPRLPRNEENRMSQHTEYKGRCFCGAVEIKVTGKPAAMGSWSAGPVNAFSLWAPRDVTVTRGADQVGSFKKTERSVRKWCKACGGHLFTEHPSWGLVDVYAATIPDMPFEPMLHVNYSETVLRLHDALPKQNDYPAEMGGSGNLIGE
jgi:hypothetical protein